MIKQFWEEHFIKIEILIAILLGIACYFGLCHTESGTIWIWGVSSDKYQSILIALLTSFISLFGFIIAAKSIIISVSQSSSFEPIRSAPEFQTLFTAYRTAICSLAIGSIITFVLLVTANGKPTVEAVSITTFALALIFSQLANCVWILNNVSVIAAQPIENNLAQPIVDSWTNWLREELRINKIPSKFGDSEGKLEESGSIEFFKDKTDDQNISSLRWSCRKGELPLRFQYRKAGLNEQTRSFYFTGDVGKLVEWLQNQIERDSQFQ